MLSAAPSSSSLARDSGCLDDDAVLLLVTGALDEAARASANRHLAECDDCRALVSQLARAQSTSTTAPADHAISGPRASTSRPLPLLPGDRIGDKYRVDGVLGTGGMGVVVSAWHVPLERSVAIKLLLPELAADPQLVARFLREARAASRLASPHVVRILDVDTLDRRVPYLVMERLEGVDLAAHLTARGPMPPADAVRLVLHACDALAEAHACGIVHRDVKPANLFLTATPDGAPLLKVLDFGIAKVRDDGLDTTRAQVGSPRYMSPEQMTAARDVDARTDLWALGAVLFELLTGAPAFEGSSLDDLRRSVVRGAPPRARAIAPRVPVGLERVIQRCLAKAPAQRFASAGALAAALAPYAPKDARPLAERLACGAGVAVPRRRVAPIAGAFALVTLGALGAAVAREPPGATRALARGRDSARDAATLPASPTPAATTIASATAAARAQPVAAPRPTHAPSSAPPQPTAAQPEPPPAPPPERDPHGLADRK